MPRRVVLISDLQQGSRLDALGDFEWPSDVELDLKTVADAGSNAGLQRLADPAEAEPGRGRPAAAASGSPTTRARAARRSSCTGSTTRGPRSASRSTSTSRPGESRVVRVPRPPGAARPGRSGSKGDAHAFDNTLYFADERQEEATVLYVGNDAADDPAGLLYYLERVFEDTPRRTVQVVAEAAAGAAGARARTARPRWSSWRPRPRPRTPRRLRNYVRGGGTVLDVVAAPGPGRDARGAGGRRPPGTSRRRPSAAT